MGKNYETPVAVRGIEKIITDFTYKNGFEISSVFDDWLRFIIFGFDADHSEITDWKYKSEHSKFFMEMTQAWVHSMQNQLNGDNQWFDAFGCLYEGCIAGSSRRSNTGQFFTPEHVCDLMTFVQGNKGEQSGKGLKVSDPTCGSGRTLLSFHAHNPGNFMYGEDFDRTCAMMTTCNFLIHGVVGEVVWHDSLQPDSWFGGWTVNQNLNNPFHKYAGIPHIQKLEKEDSFVWQSWQAKKLEVEAKKLKPIEAPKEIEQPKELEKVIVLQSTKYTNQLSLF